MGEGKEVVSAIAGQMKIESTAIVHRVDYPVTEEEIAATRGRYAALSCDTPEGYEETRLAIAHLRTTRTAIEKRRVELKADALEFGRRVDTVAKRLTLLVSEIEDPLKERKAAIDDAKARAARAAEDAARAAAEAKAKAEREAEEKRIAEERAKLEAQQAVFAEAQRKADEERRQADERARVERERVEAEQRAAQAKIDAQRAELEAQQHAIREEEEAGARAEQERQHAERARIAAEERAAAEAAAAVAEAARVEAMRPDLEKIKAFAGEIRQLAFRGPTLESAAALEALAWARKKLAFVADSLDDFGPGR